MKLWLDDMRFAPPGWEWVKTPWEALELVLAYGDAIDEWSLDHDLGIAIPSGYDFLDMVETLVGYGCKLHIPATILTHTMNPVGRGRMQRAIEAIRKL
jgi:hypothetical protein